MAYAVPESPQIRFSSLSIRDGLSQNTVYAIKQDRKKYLWVATAEGLNKFDGYNFSVYKHDKNDPNSIQSDLIRNIFFDKNDGLWIATNIGLSYYERESGRFINYQLNTQVNHICQISPDVLYIATANGICKFDKASKLFKPIVVKGTKTNQAQTITLYNNLLLVGFKDGLFMSSIENVENFVPFNKELDGKNIMDMLAVPKGLWVATEGDGLYYFDAGGNPPKQYRHDEKQPKSLRSDYVRSLCYDMQDRLWVGTFTGLSIFNESSGTFDCYYNDNREPGSISQNSVRSLFLDYQGAMWIGTYYGGLNYYHPLQNRFGLLSHIPFSNSLNDNVISCIVEGKPNELWIGTNDNGVNVYDINKKSFTYYTANSGKTGLITSNNVKAILVDGDNVYVGTHGGGIGRLRRSSGAVTRYTVANSGLCNDNVYALVKTADRNIWVGTLDGLMIFHPDRQKFEPFTQDEYGQSLRSKTIYFLFPDSRNRLWIGTHSGVFVYSLDTRKLHHFPADGKTGELSDSRVNCIQEDDKKRIWIGARDGLNVFNENSQTFTSYYMGDGLPNNTVFGILQDSFGRLWISTGKGLACFIPESGKFRTYRLADGIQSDQFNDYSYCKTAGGEMYFGGINGITYFSPEQLGDNPFTPPPIISQLSLFNKVVLPGDDTRLLTKDISETEELVFRPGQSSFSLTFTVLNYLSAQHNTFAYKLDPIEKDWSYTSDIRTVSYSNLEPGNYLFSVKAANSDDKWENTPIALSIKILPYWYQTILARIVFVALILGISYFFFNFYRRRQLLKNQLAVEHLEKRKVEEVNQMKLRFFINISHEFRTPLTLMMSPLQETISRISDKWTRDQLKLALRNANKLLYLVNQLMDYRRAELGVFELKATGQDPTMQVEDCMKMFERLAKQRKIDFILESNLENRPVLYDPSYLDLILNNLLSNAFKFTPGGGTINVGLFLKQGYFVLQVQDSGCGMTEEQQKRIFDRFYQVNVENIGTGIGLSLVKNLVELHHGKIVLESVPSQGSTFHIYFPQDKSVYQEQELSAEGENRSIRKNLDESVIDLLRMPEEKKENTVMDEDKPLLLIVEDDVEVRDYLKNNFSGIANVETASNGEEALSVMKETDVDILITDLMMPVMDGVKLCKSVKQNIRTCHIPVIVLTAKTNQQDQLDALSAGADDYVAKPFNLSILKAKVQNMLKSKRRTLEHYSQTLEIDPENITFNAMDRELLEKAKNIVEKHLDNHEFSVDDFCKEMGMSRSNLHLKLKAVTGESTIDFIRKIRFSHACRLLKDGRYSISEISTMVGFNTPSYFTTSFKKYFDVLPTEYVKGNNP
jgi:signal transduction histidine kinase/ligand-binding sensor domain-containing protein/DNA-binding response OmpR family regulator